MTPTTTKKQQGGKRDKNYFIVGRSQRIITLPSTHAIHTYVHTYINMYQDSNKLYIKDQKIIKK